MCLLVVYSSKRSPAKTLQPKSSGIEALVSHKDKAHMDKGLRVACRLLSECHHYLIFRVLMRFIVARNQARHRR